MTERALVTPFPDDFPNKGKYVVWDKHWNRAGYVSATASTLSLAIVSAIYRAKEADNG